MDSTFKFLGFGASLVIGSLMMAGCSEGTDDPAGTGGSTGTTGGSTGTTGGSGAGGATGGSSTAGTKLFTFDEDEQGFKLNNSPGSAQYPNLGSLTGTAAPKVEYVSDKDAGNAASSGALRIKANFTFWNQSVSAEAAPPLDANGAPIDFTNKTVSARVFVEPNGLSPFGFGENPDAPGGVVFFMKSGTTYAWGQAAWFNVTMYDSWFTVKFDAEKLDSGSSAEFDPSNVVQLGFQFSSGGGGTHCPDAAMMTFAGEPSATCPAWPGPLATTVYVDNITVTPNP